MSKDVYEWRAPWVYKGINATRVKRELSKLEIDGEVNAETIVQYAKNHPRSELHKCFEWSNASAANKWRTHQARLILGNLRKVVIHGGEVALERTHFHVKGAGYLTRERVDRDPEAKSVVLHRARRAIEELIERCYEIETLAEPEVVEHLSMQLLDKLHEETIEA